MKSILIFENLIDGINGLPEEIRGEAALALLNYCNTGVKPEGLSPTVDAIMEMLSVSIEHGVELRENRSNKMKGNTNACKYNKKEEKNITFTLENRDETDKKQTENRDETDLKQKQNRNETEKKQTQNSPSLSLSLSNSITDTSELREKENNANTQARAREEPLTAESEISDEPLPVPAPNIDTTAYRRFVKEFDIVEDNYDMAAFGETDWVKVEKAFKESPDFLQKKGFCHATSWICRNRKKIEAGLYSNKSKKKDYLQEAFMREGDNGTGN